MKSPGNQLTIFLLLTISLFSVSCDRGPVYEKYMKMKNSTWDRFDPKLFDIPIETPAKNIDITFVVRVTSNLAYDELPFYIVLTTPAGKERIREIKIRPRPLKVLITPEKDCSKRLWDRCG